MCRFNEALQVQEFELGRVCALHDVARRCCVRKLPRIQQMRESLMRSFAYLSFAVLVAGSVSAQAGDAPASVNGSWTGEMRQIDADRETRYPMMVSLNGAKGTTTYPTLKCTGTLSRLGTSKAGYVVFQETVKNDPGGNCIDGVVTVTTDAGKLLLGWYGVFDGAPSLASATLDKDAK